MFRSEWASLSIWLLVILIAQGLILQQSKVEEFTMVAGIFGLTTIATWLGFGFFTGRFMHWWKPFVATLATVFVLAAGVCLIASIDNPWPLATYIRAIVKVVLVGMPLISLVYSAATWVFWHDWNLEDWLQKETR